MSLTQNLAIVATVDSQLLNNGYAFSDYANMGVHQTILWTASLGLIDTTFDMALYAASDSSGTGSVAISGKSITQLAQTADNKQVSIEINASSCPAGKPYVACKVTSGNGTSGCFVSVVGLAGNSRYKPGTDLASVAEEV